MNIIERRSNIDRRNEDPSLFCKYWFTGRRAIPRRQEDRCVPKKVDRYSNKILFIIILILVLSVLDAVFTLNLVEKGAKEMNPIMNYYLERSPMLFLWIKYLLTCASVLLVLYAKDYYIFRTKFKARVLFFILPIPFILIIHWQLGLMWFVF